MGGFFSPPSPPPPPPLPEPVDTEAEDRERRLETIERRRRGRSGTIATSERGILNEETTGAVGASSQPLKEKLGD